MFSGMSGFGGAGARASTNFGQWYTDMQDAKEVKLFAVQIILLLVLPVVHPMTARRARRRSGEVLVSCYPFPSIQLFTVVAAAQN